MRREASGPRRRGRRRREVLLPPPLPLVRPAPRSAMFLPIVVLVAVLPGLYALRCWDLTPPGPWWGLRGLAVLDGQLARSDRCGGRAGAGGVGVSGGGLAAAPVCLAGGGRPGLEPQPVPAGDGPAQLPRGGAGRAAGLPARPALARARPGGGGGDPDRFQSRPAGADAAGDADDAGPGRSAGGLARVRALSSGRARGSGSAGSRWGRSGSPWR